MTVCREKRLLVAIHLDSISKCFEVSTENIFLSALVNEKEHNLCCKS